MNDIKQTHQQEMANLSMEYYDLIKRKEAIEGRMRELGVILRTVDAMEKDGNEPISDAS